MPKSLRTLLIYAAALAVWFVPLLRVEVPALSDYPNHLARAYIRDAHAVEPLLREHYVIEDKLYPYGHLDAIIGWLHPTLSIYQAGTATILLVFVVLISGVALLRRSVHGEVGLVPLLTCLVLYNHVLSWGFLNFLFATGLLLWAFAAFLALPPNTPRWALAATYALSALLLYYLHPFAVGFYLVLIASYWGGEVLSTPGWQARATRLARELAYLVPAVALVVAVVVFSFDSITLAGAAATDEFDASSKLQVQWFSLTKKVFYSLSPLYFAPEQLLDRVLIILPGALYLAVRHFHAVTVHPRLRAPLLVFVAVTVLSPQLLLGVHYFDMRPPLVLALVLIAAVDWVPGSPKRAAVGVLALLLAYGAGRLVAVDRLLQGCDVPYTAFRQAIAPLDRPAPLLQLETSEGPEHGPDDPGTCTERSRFWHLGLLAVIDKQWYLPDLFKVTTPVKEHPRYSHIAPPIGIPVDYSRWRNEPATEYWTTWEQDYGYIVVYTARHPLVEVPEGLTVLTRHPRFVLLSNDAYWARQGDAP